MDDEESEPDEHLTYLELVEKLSGWPYPKIHLPMIVTLAGVADVIQYLTSKGIRYKIESDETDSDAYFLVNLKVSNIEIMRNLNPETVWFQTPDLMEECEPF